MTANIILFSPNPTSPEETYVKQFYPDAVCCKHEFTLSPHQEKNKYMILSFDPRIGAGPVIVASCSTRQKAWAKAQMYTKRVLKSKFILVDND